MSVAQKSGSSAGMTDEWPAAIAEVRGAATERRPPASRPRIMTRREAIPVPRFGSRKSGGADHT